MNLYGAVQKVHVDVVEKGQLAQNMKQNTDLNDWLVTLMCWKSDRKLLNRKSGHGKDNMELSINCITVQEVCPMKKQKCYDEKRSHSAHGADP